MRIVKSRRSAWLVFGLGLGLLILGSWSGAQFRRATLLSPFFRAPSGLAVSANREVLVAVEESRIHIYDDEGNFLRGWGLSPELGAIRLRLVGQDTVEVARQDHHSVAVYDLKGELLSSRDEPGAFAALAADHDMRVIAADGDAFELSPEGLVRKRGSSVRLIVSTPHWPLEIFGEAPLIPIALSMAGGAIVTMIGLVMTASSAKTS